MQGLDSGWAWFDVAEEIEEKGRPTGVDSDLLKAYVRTFRSESGRRVILHLRSITSERVLGPDASDAVLRHLEGQRQLVYYIASLVERGSDRVVDFGLTTGKSNQGSMEIKND